MPPNPIRQTPSAEFVAADPIPKSQTPSGKSDRRIAQTPSAQLPATQSLALLETLRALSRNKAAMLSKGQKRKPEDAVSVEEEIKDAFVLEFLGLKDEYSESDLEEALIQRLEQFLLELGGDFAFVGRQRRLRIGDEWYRLDLLFFHRRLK